MISYWMLVSCPTPTGERYEASGRSESGPRIPAIRDFSPSIRGVARRLKGRRCRGGRWPANMPVSPGGSRGSGR